VCAGWVFLPVLGAPVSHAPVLRFDLAPVPIAALLLRPIWKMSVRETAGVFGVAVAVHVPINLIGYAIGARQRPI
jgi:hypothetical protein